MSLQQNEDSREPVFSRNVIEMLTVANEYCLFLEKAAEYPKEVILPFLQKICPLIYLKASLLPDITDPDDEFAEHFVKEEEWETLFNSLQTKFGNEDPYFYFDPFSDGTPDLVKASLAEAFADIYQDLKDFITLYQKPRKASMEFAVYECKQLFESHFGFLLVNAQQALHYQMYRNSVKNGDDTLSGI